MDASDEWVWHRGNYDEVGRRLVGLADELVSEADATLGGVASLRVVDLACGTGNVALAAASRGAFVTGVDLGSALLSIARERGLAAGLDADWVLADVTDTGLPEAAFDAALSNVGLIFVADRAAAIAEVARLLRPGGCLSFTAWVKDVDNPMSKPFERFLPADDGDGPKSWDWAEPAVVQPLLVKDFDEVRIDRAELVWSFDTVAEALHLIESSPLHVAALTYVDAADHTALRAAFTEEFGALCGPDGRLSYSSPYVRVTARRKR